MSIGIFVGCRCRYTSAKNNQEASCGCFLHQNSESDILICDKQTAVSLLLLAQKSLRNLPLAASSTLIKVPLRHLAFLFGTKFPPQSTSCCEKYLSEAMPALVSTHFLLPLRWSIKEKNESQNKDIFDARCNGGWCFVAQADCGP